MAKGKLIVASARLPVTMKRRQGKWEASTSTGGLVTALNAVERPFNWLGWPGTNVPEADFAAVEELLADHGASPVFITKQETSGFYEGISNEALWPLFHSRSDRVRFDLNHWRSFESVNRRFADRICHLAEPGDQIWIHDYQLALVPELVRRRGLRCAIGFFLHIPFPAAETYRALPVREEILHGMLGADLIGFHAYEYVSHFRNSCLRVLGLESEPDVLNMGGRDVRLATLPIGIDADEVKQMCSGGPAQRELSNLEVTYAGKKLVVGVDRLDYTKGIPQKLLAFEALLQEHPRWRNRVVLVQVAAPSRTNVEEYRQLKREVDELVGRINGRFGSSSHTPVVYVNQNVPRERLAGLYQAADVALITPVRDGMNLVALEYVAARRERGGTLILSEFTGAAHSLAGAKLVNPYSTHGVATALRDALEDDSTNAGFKHMLEFVEENTSSRWAARFLEQLDEVPAEPANNAMLLDLTNPAQTVEIARAKKPLVLLDYDGTLRAYVSKPADAAPEERTLKTLAALAEVAEVYVVSGRSAQTLEEWLGHLDIGLVCEHGLAVRHRGQDWQERIAVNGEELSELVVPTFWDFVRKTPGSAIEFKQAALAWHYRAADPEYAAFQVRELITVLEDRLGRHPYKVLRGSRVIEVRHEGVTKGGAVDELLQGMPEVDFVFCAGDDRTDEDMMTAVSAGGKPHLTCWVGARNPHAGHWTENCGEFVDELARLAEVWTRTDSQRGEI